MVFLGGGDYYTEHFIHFYRMSSSQEELFCLNYYPSEQKASKIKSAKHAKVNERRKKIKANNNFINIVTCVIALFYS